MIKFIGCLLICAAPLAAIADDIVLDNAADLEGEIILESIGETLESSDLELNQMSTPDLPKAVLPDIFKNIHEDEPTASVDSEPEPADVNTPSISENVIINVIDVRETFYKLEFNSDTNIYTRSETNEARPGDLIELVITATNNGDETVDDVEMVNNVPTGPVQLLGDSITTDLNSSLYRLSRNGSDFFPAEAGIEPASVKYIQWLIFTMKPGQSFEFKYRIQIDK